MQLWSELIHLEEPVYSQTQLLRLNPLARPYGSPVKESLVPNVNYLLNISINPVSSDLISTEVFDPWNNTIPTDNIIPFNVQ